MAIGKLADVFFNETATFSGGAWAVALPVTNLAQMERFVERPARCVTPENLADSQFDAALDRPRGINLVGLCFHNLSLSAKYRLTVAGAGGSLAAPVYDSGWTRVWRRLFKSKSLPWATPNWWTGGATTADLNLYRRHLWMPLPARMVASAIRVELDDQANPAGWIDIGSCWITATWGPQTNYERGRSLGMLSRDLSEEGPSGRTFSQFRDGRRTLSPSWTGLDDAEAQRFFDAGARCGTSRPVLFIPDIDDQPGRLREAFPSTFQRPPGPQFFHPKTGRLSVTFEEILA